LLNFFDDYINGKKKPLSPKIPKIPKRNSKNYSKIPAVISQMTNYKTCVGIFFKFSKNLTNPEKNSQNL
jgi:hypothetical protein